MNLPVSQRVSSLLPVVRRRRALTAAEFEHGLHAALRHSTGGCHGGGRLALPAPSVLCGNVGVAVSGGADSTALWLLAGQWAARRGARLQAFTVT